MPFTRYQHSCVGRCNRPQSPARRTGHRTTNGFTASFPLPSTLCPHQHLRNDLLLISVSRASILPNVCVFSPYRFHSTTKPPNISDRNHGSRLQVMSDGKRWRDSAVHSPRQTEFQGMRLIATYIPYVCYYLGTCMHGHGSS